MANKEFENMNPKILVLSPIGRHYEESIKSILDIDYDNIQFLFDKGPVIDISDYKSRLAEIVKGRNRLYEQSMKIDYDLELWIDADIVVPKTIAYDMKKYIDEGEKIVSVGYTLRRGVFSNTKLYKKGDKTYSLTSGFGCVMMPKEVHRIIGEFKCMYGSSEDISFCSTAIKKYHYEIRNGDGIILKHLAVTEK